jgi:hypothetical protein
MWGKGMGEWIWCKYCEHMYVNGKMIPVETTPGMMGGGWRRMMEGWIQLWYIVKTFVNVTMYPQFNNNKKENKTNKTKQLYGA